MSDRTVGRADYEARVDHSRMDGDLRDAEGKIEASGRKVEREQAEFGRRMEKGLMVFGAAMGAAGIAALRMGDDYKDAVDSIRTGTGQTGEALAGLEQSWRNVAGRVKEDIGVVAQVLADLNTRTDLTGDALEDLTEQVILFSRVTGTDPVRNVELVTRLFGDWSIATEDQAETLDQLFRASQNTGIGVESLMGKVVQFGAPMRALGLSFEESIALLGKWEKEGVNIETVLSGMRMAVANFAKAGIDPREGLPALIEQIRGADDATGLLMAKQIVGQRAANDFFRAVKEGRFDVEDLMDTIENGSETVNSAAEDTRRFGDGIAELKNKIKLAIGPIAQDFAGLTEEFGNAIYLLPVLGGALGKLTGKILVATGASKALHGAWLTMKGAMLGIAGPLAIITGGIAIAALAWLDWNAAVERGTERGKALVRELGEMNGGIRTQADVVKVAAEAEERALRELAVERGKQRSDFLETQAIIGPLIGVWRDLIAEQEANAAVTVTQEEAQRQLAETLKKELAQALDEYLAGLGRIQDVMRELGPDFKLTEEAIATLARRFGVDASEIVYAWEVVQEEFAEKSALIRDHLASLPPDFRLTSESAQEMATLLGVSVADVERAYAEMYPAVAGPLRDTRADLEKTQKAAEEWAKAQEKAADEAASAIEEARGRIKEAVDGITGALSSLGTGGEATNYFEQFKEGAEGSFPDVQTRIEQLRDQIRDLDAVNREELTPNALASWLQMRLGAEDELGALELFADNHGEIIANILPYHLANAEQPLTGAIQSYIDIPMEASELLRLQAVSDAAETAASFPDAFKAAARELQVDATNYTNLPREKLEQLNERAQGLARATSASLPFELGRSLPTLTRNVDAVEHTVRSGLAGLPGIGTRAGSGMTAALAAAIKAGQGRVKTSVHGVAQVVRSGFKLDSPSKEGPWSEAGGPFAWLRRDGEGMIEQLTRGLDRKLPKLGDKLDEMATLVARRPALELAPPRWSPAEIGLLPGQIAPMTAGAMGGGGTTVIHKHYSATVQAGVLVADDAGLHALSEKLHQVERHWSRDE